MIILCVQRLYEKGARKFGFLSLSPLGCLPALRAANPEANKGGCFEAASALALAHNNALSNILTSLNQVLKGFMYTNSNFYDWLQDKINNPTKYGTSFNPIYYMLIFTMSDLCSTNTSDWRCVRCLTCVSIWYRYMWSNSIILFDLCSTDTSDWRCIQGLTCVSIWY